MVCGGSWNVTWTQVSCMQNMSISPLRSLLSCRRAFIGGHSIFLPELVLFWGEFCLSGNVFISPSILMTKLQIMTSRLKVFFSSLYLPVYSLLEYGFIWEICCQFHVAFLILELLFLFCVIHILSLPFWLWLLLVVCLSLFIFKHYSGLLDLCTSIHHWGELSAIISSSWFFPVPPIDVSINRLFLLISFSKHFIFSSLYFKISYLSPFLFIFKHTDSAFSIFSSVTVTSCFIP